MLRKSDTTVWCFLNNDHQDKWFRRVGTVSTEVWLERRLWLSSVTQRWIIQGDMFYEFLMLPVAINLFYFLMGRTV